MGFIYSLGYLIPFLIFLKILYLREFDKTKAAILWFFHVLFTIIGGKLFYILYNNKSWKFLFEPYGFMGIGVVLFAYFYLFVIGLLFRKDPIRLWNKLSILAPLGIILIRTGNILNGEAQGIINYATIEIISALIIIFLLLKFRFLRENSTLFVFIFYYLTRLLIAEPIRQVSFLNYIYAFLFAIIFFATYIFIYRLREKGLFN
jgi:prolipoprotein diacylglyceryltransferase